MLTVTVVGQGYVGLPLAIQAAQSGCRVFGFDEDKSKILSLLEGKIEIKDINIKKVLSLIKHEMYTPTYDPEIMKTSDVIVIAVPTPLNLNREPDLNFLISASKNIAKYCKSDALIINESTSYPGTLRNVIAPIFKEEFSKRVYLAVAPERIDPANKNWNIENTPRIIGGLDEKATQLAFNFYSLFCKSVLKVTNPEVAEAAKLFENTYRLVNIALANEFSLISKALGFSTNEAIQAASTKPFGFMPFYPSLGVGGHCIPIDPTYLSYAADRSGVKSYFIELANKTISTMLSRVLDEINDIFGRHLTSARIQIAGISYKSEVSDLRESPAIRLIQELKKRGALVTWHDPVVKEWNGEYSSILSKDIDIGLIVTPHKDIDFSVWKENENSIKVFDLSANSINFGWPKFF